jgi:hypothetical protein
MIIMIDEIFDRHYQESRHELNDAIGRGFSRLGRAVSNAFEVLNRIEYSAPWAAKAPRARSH